VQSLSSGGRERIPEGYNEFFGRGEERSIGKRANKPSAPLPSGDFGFVIEEPAKLYKRERGKAHHRVKTLVSGKKERSGRIQTVIMKAAWGRRSDMKNPQFGGGFS